MNLKTTGSGDARKIAPVYLVRNGEMMLEGPIRDVWRHVINYPSWQNYSTVLHISGEAGREGEVVLLNKEEKGFKFPSYYARTVKLESPSRVIWKTWPENAAEEIDFFGIVEFRLDEVGGKTRFWYQSLYEFLVPYHHEAELDEFRKQQNENASALYASIYPKLRALVEQRDRR